MWWLLDAFPADPVHACVHPLSCGGKDTEEFNEWGPYTVYCTENKPSPGDDPLPPKPVDETEGGDTDGGDTDSGDTGGDTGGDTTPVTPVKPAVVIPEPPSDDLVCKLDSVCEIDNPGWKCGKFEYGASLASKSKSYCIKAAECGWEAENTIGKYRPYCGSARLATFKATALTAMFI